MDVFFVDYEVWLRTEYDTAVKRTEQARQWKQFEDERDILPNLRWVPPTAATPGADHMIFWDTVLPIDDPFWSQHKPGDRWGCQCSLEATDEPATPIPSGTDRDDPAPGLDGNPAQDGKLFSDSHPYYRSCGNCPFKTDGSAPSTPTNKTKDCANCPYLKNCTQTDYSRGISERRNTIQKEALLSIKGIRISHEEMPDVLVSRSSIKEILNQPYSHYAEKNEIILNIADIFSKSKHCEPHPPYKQSAKTKYVTLEHSFKIIIAGESSWLIVYEYQDGSKVLHGITEFEKAIKG